MSAAGANRATAFVENKRANFPSKVLRPESLSLPRRESKGIVGTRSAPLDLDVKPADLRFIRAKAIEDRQSDPLTDRLINCACISLN